MKILVEENKDIDDFTIYLTLIELHRSYLLLISNNEQMGIGNVTLGSPSTIEGLKSTASSYKLFGVNNKLISTIIIEKATKILKAPVLLLLFLKTNKKELDIVKPIISFLNDSLGEYEKKK